MPECVEGPRSKRGELVHQGVVLLRVGGGVNRVNGDLMLESSREAENSTPTEESKLVPIAARLGALAPRILEEGGATAAYVDCRRADGCRTRAARRHRRRRWGARAVDTRASSNGGGHL